MPYLKSGILLTFTLMNIIITGASKGIGKAVAEVFAAHGHNLVICSRNEVSLYKTVEELLVKYPGIEVKAKPADLGNKKEAQDFGNWILEKNIFPDILINNAGQFIPGSIHNEEDQVLEKLMSVNLYSAYHLTRTLLPVMMKEKKGAIFNICSIASLKAYDNGGSYSISKFGLLGFSKNLREEMKPYGIKVTAVIPGAVYTDSWAGSGIPEERMLQVKDLADMIYTASQLSAGAVVEDIILRPQLGDL
jgi:short-subunit dehydrogenase